MTTARDDRPVIMRHESVFATRVAFAGDVDRIEAVPVFIRGIA